MANTTFSGPVVALNGFIGGPNANASGTDQGGTATFDAGATGANVTTIVTTDGTRSLVATANEGVIAYVKNGANGTSVSCYVFSDGAQWLQLNDPTSTVA